MQALSIKILLSYHKPSYIVHNEIFTPMHVGRASSALSCDEMVLMETKMPGDDTGENISAKNASYAELTGIYWVWKNYARIGNPDYIGFAHYRRFMVFHPAEQETPVHILPNFSQQELNHYMAEDSVHDAIRQYDMLVPKRIGNVSPEDPTKILTLRQHWETVHGTAHLEKALDCARKLFPECGHVIDEYINAISGYWWNMLVARKEIFFEYCHFIFSILAEMEKTDSFSDCVGYNRRMPGFIAERLTGVYIMMKMQEGHYKIGEYSIIYLNDSVQHEELNTALLVRYQQKHFWYGIFSNLTFGSMRQKYCQKRRFAKDMLRHIQKIINHLSYCTAERGE